MKKALTTQVNKCTMGIKKSNLRVCVLLGFYVLFIVIGASIFSAIEGPVERQKAKALRKTRNTFLRDNKCLSGDGC